jgi:hypothetical protein
VGLPGAGSTDQDGVTLLGKESAAGKVAHQCLIDWGAIELEVVEVLGERQLGDGELVLDRAQQMERSELFDLMGELQLYGTKAATSRR